MDDFSRNVAERLGIHVARLPRPGEWSGTGQTIGALALRLGLLDLSKIERVLDRQLAKPEKFGVLAVELGLLTREKVDQLLRLQQVHRRLELLEQLYLSHQMGLRQGLELLASCTEDAAERAKRKA